jgi:hypothetical protein
MKQIQLSFLSKVYPKLDHEALTTVSGNNSVGRWKYFYDSRIQTDYEWISFKRGGSGDARWASKY